MDNKNSETIKKEKTIKALKMIIKLSKDINS